MKERNIIIAVIGICLVIAIILLASGYRRPYFNSSLGAAAYGSSFSAPTYAYPNIQVPTMSSYTVTNYDQCRAAGYRITGTNPVVCTTPYGQVYQQTYVTTTSAPAQEQVTTYTTTTQTPTVVVQPQTQYQYQYPQTTQYQYQYPTQYQYSNYQGQCYVSGCSREICSDQQNTYSACQYAPQLACYQQNSTCTRQYNGQCGWTQTQGLLSCLRQWQ
jgi:uncharacterized membrane protein